MISIPLRRWYFILWPLLLLLLFWALRSIPLYSVLDTLAALRLYQLAILGALNAVILFLLSSRWWLILRAMGYQVSYLSLLGYRLASFGISYFTPGGQFGGEPLQVYMLRRRHHLPGAAALASVSLDKVIELAASFTFLCAGFVLILNGGLAHWLAHSQTVLAIAVLLALPLLYFLALLGGFHPISFLIQRLPARIQKTPPARRLLPVISAAEKQTTFLFRQNPLLILWMLLLSALTWTLMLLEYWLMLSFLGVDLSLSQAVIALTAARLAFLTPAPGGLVALEAGQIFILQLLGAESAAGVSASLLIRIRDVATGVFGLWWAGMLSRSGAAEPVPIRTTDP